MHNNIVQGVFAVGSTVYAATFSGLYVSTDGGNSFTQRDASSFTANDVYANDSGTTIYIASDGGLKISTNSGASYVTKDAVTGGLLANNVRDVYAVGLPQRPGHRVPAHPHDAPEGAGVPIRAGRTDARSVSQGRQGRGDHFHHGGSLWVDRSHARSANGCLRAVLQFRAQRGDPIDP